MKTNAVDKAYEIIKGYNGYSNYMKYLQYKVNSCHYILNDFDIEYIINNKDFVPYELNKTVKISVDFGRKLNEKFLIGFTPEKIRISSVIGEMGNSFHCYIQYRQSVPPVLTYVNKNNILTPLETVDYNTVEVDFDKYDKSSKDGRKLKILQKEGIKFLLANRKCILADSMGTGKEQDVNTLIPTPTGYKRIGDIKVGDVVFGSNGKKCNVTAVFPQGKKDIYEIEFSDGSITNCGLEHLWFVKDKTSYNRKKDWKVLSLKEILKRGIEYTKRRKSKSIWKHNYKFRIPICKPVEYDSREHIINPYLMGIMIGDGNLCNGGICISIPDSEIETLNRITPMISNKYKFTPNRSGACPNYRISKKNPSKKPNTYMEEIRRLKLDVKGNYKFIPQEYMFDSVENRIELLRGLMDSDGTISKKGNKISYSTNSLKLANDVIELVQSLGGLAHLMAFDRRANNKSINYVVSIKIEICPFHLRKKVERYTITDGKPKYLVKSIKNIKLHHQNDAICIKVDSEDHSYLTNSYIVTHNTTQSIVAAMASNSKKILIITTASLKTNWKRELTIYNDEKDIQILQGSKDEICDKKYVIANYDILINYYEVPTETVYETEYVYNENGKREVIRKPVMVKSKDGQLIEKQKKSTRKDVIEECLKNSPLFLNKFDCVIIDEAQKLSNNSSNRYKVIDDFLKRAKPNYVFLLTGTPLTNKPINLYYILKLIDAPITRDYRYFIKRYCDAKTFRLKTGKEVTTINGASNLEELREKIKHLYIRRLLTEMTDMVDKNIITKTYDLTELQRVEYERLWQEYLDAQIEQGNEDSEQYRQLVEGILVRQYLAKQMVDNTIKLVDDMLEEGGKVIIVCTFAEEIAMFKNYYKKKCVVYDGKMTAKAKDKAEQAFNNDKNVRVFIGQILAAGVGLNLVVANKMVFNSYSWVAADNAQIEDRIYRLTQKNDVTCVYQLFNDSMSKHMYDTVIGKKNMMDTIIKSEINK